LSYKSKGGHGYGNQIRRAKRVQARRSNHAKAIDSSLKAPMAKDVEQWLSAPNRFDLPNVDTNKPKKETRSCRVSQKYFWENDNANKIFDRLINKDDIEENNTANRKALEKILEVLDENKIPYYEAEGVGVQVLRSDMEKAEKLTDKLYEVLKKTS
jgi:hypothetical protein